METILWWTMAVIVPVVAVVGYWFIARAQVRRATRKLAERLDAERLLRRRVSHQVRNPLTVIYGFSEALLDTDLDDPDEVRSVLTTINSEALAVSRTVENLVTASKVANEELAPRSIPFEPAVEIKRAIVPFQRIGTEITIDVPDQTGVGDPVLFRQVIQNLVVNAVRHGGSEISVVATRHNGTFSCIVADDGDGLHPVLAQHLFPAPVVTEADAEGEEDVDQEPVEATAEIMLTEPKIHEEGLGLGLPVSISLAKEMGGALEYERSVGAAMFTLTLPTAGWPDPPPQPVPAAEPVAEQVHIEGEEDLDTPTPEPEPEPVYTGPTISFDVTSEPVIDLEPAEDDFTTDGTGSSPSVEASTPS